MVILSYNAKFYVYYNIVCEDLESSFEKSFLVPATPFSSESGQVVTNLHIIYTRISRSRLCNCMVSPCMYIYIQVSGFPLSFQFKYIGSVVNRCQIHTCEPV